MADLKIDIDQLSKSIDNTLQEYSKERIDKLKQATKDAADELVEETKATAPRDRPRYYKNIKNKKTLDDSLKSEYTWYVGGSEYRLSHLIEYGHATRDGDRTDANPFISTATNRAIEKYLKKVEDVYKGD